MDLVIVAPRDAAASLAAGRHAVMTVLYDAVSPYRAFLAVTAADRVASAVNAQLVAAAAGTITGQLTAAGQQVPPALRPELLASPVQADPEDVAPSGPAIVPFYGLAVLALIVQHVGVTLSGLAMLRDRRRGLVEMFRLAPIRSGEMLVGKYLAAGFLTALVTAIVVAAMIAVLHVPLLGDLTEATGALALLVVSATGLGLLIALVADSERQVVQLALLLLLASVFFSGLAIDLSQFAPAIRIGAQILPVTEATALLQDVFLRGATDEPWRYAVLAGMGGHLVRPLRLAAASLVRRQPLTEYAPGQAPCSVAIRPMISASSAGRDHIGQWLVGRSIQVRSRSSSRPASHAWSCPAAAFW